MVVWGYSKKKKQSYPKNGNKKNGISEKILTDKKTANEDKLTNLRMLQLGLKKWGKSPALPAVYDKKTKTLKTMELEYPEEDIDPITGKVIIQPKISDEELAYRGSKDRFGKLIRVSGISPLASKEEKEKYMKLLGRQQEMLRFFINPNINPDIGENGLDKYGTFSPYTNQKIEQRLAGYFFKDRSRKPLEKGIDPDTNLPVVDVKNFNWRSLGGKKTREENNELVELLIERRDTNAENRPVRALGMPYFFQTVGGLKQGTNSLRVYGFKTQLEAEQAGLSYVMEKNKNGVERWKELLMKPYNKLLLEQLLTTKKFRTKESRQKSVEEMTVNDLTPELSFFTNNIMTDHQRVRREANIQRGKRSKDIDMKKLAELNEAEDKLKSLLQENATDKEIIKDKMARGNIRTVGKIGRLQSAREETKADILRRIRNESKSEVKSSSNKFDKPSEKTLTSIGKGLSQANEEIEKRKKKEATKEDTE